MPGYAKIIMLLQSMVILFLTFWVLQEYTYNIYFQAYVNDMVQTNGSLIAILVFVSSLGLGSRTFQGAKINAPPDWSPSRPATGSDAGPSRIHVWRQAVHRPSPDGSRLKGRNGAPRDHRADSTDRNQGHATGPALAGAA